MNRVSHENKLGNHYDSRALYTYSYMKSLSTENRKYTQTNNKTRNITWFLYAHRTNSERKHARRFQTCT